MTFSKDRPINISYLWEYEKLTYKQRKTLHHWIKIHVEPYRINTYKGVTSHAIKFLFEIYEEGFYITDGQLKAALDVAGFKPEETWQGVWEYTLSARILFDY